VVEGTTSYNNIYLFFCIMDLALILFGLGTLGFIFNRNNLILMLISVEIILLAVSVMTLFFAWQFNDIYSEVFSLYVISVAGAESAIGLAIIIAYFKIRKLTSRLPYVWMLDGPRYSIIGISINWVIVYDCIDVILIWNTQMLLLLLYSIYRLYKAGEDRKKYIWRFVWLIILLTSWLVALEIFIDKWYG